MRRTGKHASLQGAHFESDAPETPPHLVWQCDLGISALGCRDSVQLDMHSLSDFVGCFLVETQQMPIRLS